MDARTTDPVQFELQCDIVRAAYEFALNNYNEHTQNYMKELMESYGIERAVQ